MIVVKLECKKCGRIFDFNPNHYSILELKEIPKKCPYCLDVEHNMKKAVVQRELIKEYRNVKIERVILKKEKVEEKYSYLSFGGRNFGTYGGASFSNKYLIFINNLIDVDNLVGKVVDIRVMQKVWVGDDKVEKTNKYIVFDPVNNENDIEGYLYTLESYYKTTLSGIGRDVRYKEKLKPVEGDSFDYEELIVVSSGSRSGRYGNRYEMIVTKTPCEIVEI